MSADLAKRNNFRTFAGGKVCCVVRWGEKIFACNAITTQHNSAEPY